MFMRSQDVEASRPQSPPDDPFQVAFSRTAPTYEPADPKRHQTAFGVLSTESYWICADIALHTFFRDGKFVMYNSNIP